ncbi:hypothetical protein BH18ACI5_BH18ACI5_12080 [soil metagenome]
METRVKGPQWWVPGIILSAGLMSLLCMLNYQTRWQGFSREPLCRLSEPEVFN